MNIQSINQGQQPNFGRTVITYPVRNLKSLAPKKGHKKAYELATRSPVGKETKNALDSIKELLGKPFKRIERKFFDSSTDTVVEIQTKEGDFLTLTITPYERTTTVDRVVYENQKIKEKVSIDDTKGKGEMSKKERKIFEQIVKSMLEAGQTVQCDHLIM